ncbi:MAG: hypothetical protein HY436_00995, partial [Candidatus Liptonbacteria bacterium]|nr:hypothetical protein [Candidatus Liptonbacteria bacterium]
MKRAHIGYVIAAVAVVAALAVLFWRSDRTVAPTLDSLGAPGVTVTLAEQNDSGERGTAAVGRTADGNVRVTMNLRGAPQNPQPAHIHLGSCANLGAVKYPLSSVIDGASETVIDIPFSELQANLPLAVNVHKSADEVQVYVACGD